MSVVIHPQTIHNAIVFGGALVADIKSPRALSLWKRIQGTSLVDTVQFLSQVEVQQPCQHTLFEGQHVQHRESAHEYGDHSVTLYRFPREVTDEEAADWFEENGIQYQPVHCYHEYDCCGHWYTSGAYTYQGRKRSLIAIDWYRNV